MLTPFGNSPSSNAYNTYGGSLGAIAQYPLDKIVGAKMAVSVRKLSALYTGNYARIRRGSDNLEQDITGTFKGFTDSQAALSNGQSIEVWLNGAQGWATQWYDQSGNSLHLSQNVAVNQYAYTYPYTAQHAGYSGTVNTDQLWYYPSGLNPMVYGANKQFTFHYLTQSNVQLSSDYGMFYHIASNYAYIKGLIIRLVGSTLTGRYKIGIIGGDLVGTFNFSSLESFDNTRPHHIIVRYNGIENTSWQARLSVTVDGWEQTMNASSVLGPFPVNLESPASLARCWASKTSTIVSGLSEIMFWDRLLSDQECQWLSTNTKKTYGL